MFSFICTRRPAKGGARTALALALAASFFIAAGARAGEASIHIDNFAFTPASITVAPGTTVTWENGDDIPHSVVASDKTTFRSKVMDSEEKFSFTFKTAGTFEYFCALHPHMKGSIVVAP